MPDPCQAMRKVFPTSEQTKPEPVSRSSVNAAEAAALQTRQHEVSKHGARAAEVETQPK